MNETASNFKFLRRLVRDYPQIHMAIGLFGNATFVLGSIFFLYESLKLAGTWLFIIGTLGMLLGSIGRTLVDLDRHHQRKQNHK